ncbi:hypothetical protein [Streptomyces sp. Root369]|uniref:hypothetical protein n=1 Tax=Streptomyces sp. Root369 TaxID=1736523 RepID=UPI000708C2F5|nr:hypothetical protein [Streptomyces sp. Root369]KQW13593.1 hypothetical protein ASD08_31000 [Streptomyces sp. Root369]
MTGMQGVTPPAVHRDIALKCRLEPDTELLVNVYRNRQGGDAVARGINSGTYNAYRPSGAYQASAHPHAEGWSVWARYVEGLDLAPLAQTRIVRVPDYGRQVGYEGVRVVEVEISVRCQTCGGPRGEARSEFFVRDGVRRVRDAWTNACGHQDDYAAVLAEVRRGTDEPRRGAITPVDGGQFAQAVDLLAEALAENPWLSAKKAIPLLDGHQQSDAAQAVREFAKSSGSGTNTSAKSAAIYLVHLDTEARAADTSTTTGDEK